MKYSEKIIINTHDTDIFGNLSPTGFLRIFQSAAFDQMKEQKPSYNELFDNGYSFILSKMKIVFRSFPKASDEITVSTWACEESRGASFIRCYEAKTVGGVPVAEAKSVWAILNMNTKRLCRISDLNLNYSTDLMLDIELKRKFTFDTEPAKVGEKEIVYGDCDMNLHMNNTKYANLLWGFVPDFKNSLPVSLEINFLAEASLGDTISVYRASTGNGYYFKTVRNDGKTNTEAFFETKKSDL